MRLNISIANEDAKFPHCERSKAISSQKGFSLIAAVFILAVLSLAGAFVVKIVALGSATNSQAIQSARALSAARSGLEWGTYQIINVQPAATCFTSPTSFSYTQGGLNGFSTTVTCTVQAANVVEGGGTPYSVYVLTSTASRGTVTSSDYVSRVVEMVIFR